MSARDPLPVDSHLERIARAVESDRRVVVVAPPGAGKSTRVPPALLGRGPLLLLQPRRVAARALARRIAAEEGLELGEDVGWQLRLERRFTERTRLLVATEGILVARLQSDPLLSGFATVVVDEAHERSIHADLSLAMAREAAEARDDLALVVMSATLDAGPVADFLGGATVVEVEGRAHPVEIEHAPDLTVAAGVRRALETGEGDVLAFLPGAREIADAAGELRDLRGVAVRPLHGGLSADEQDRALRPGRGRRVVLATNVAETSLTVEGVRAVVDSGLHKVVRLDRRRGLDRLLTERIPRDSADQRAGRAGRTAPGRALRLWDERERLAPRREPEILRVDLAGPVLEVAAWGADPRTFRWLEAPPSDALDDALLRLEGLGAIERRRRGIVVTPLGRRLRRLPVAPRLARALAEAPGSWRLAAACVLLSERIPPLDEDPAATACDLFPRIDALERDDRPWTAPLRRSVEALHREARRAFEVEPSPVEERAVRRALACGFPDRLARRRERGAQRLLLASGAGARLSRRSVVTDGELLLALDVQAAERDREALVHVACVVEPDWIEPDAVAVEHEWDATRGRVRAFERERRGAIVLRERPADPVPEVAERVLAERLAERELDDASRRWLRRAEVAGVEIDLEAIRRHAVVGRTELPSLDVSDWLEPDQREAIARLAPDRVDIPSGRSVALDYRDDGTVALAAKLQELFGLPEPPRVGPRREPVLVELLSPAGRPVQATRDLASFWREGYARVRAELRGRYPKHPWPEDPLTARATALTKRRLEGRS